MENFRLQTPLPADLPTDWVAGQTVAPEGAEVGLSEKHGYNYLCAQVNQTQQAVNTLGDACEGFALKEEVQAALSQKADLRPDGKVAVAVSADALGGKTEGQLSVASAVNAQNSDTLDGQHASAFAPSGFGLGGYAANVTDWNAALETGWYCGNAINGPYDGWLMGYSMYSGPAYIVQRVCNYSDINYTCSFWERRMINGTWIPWRLDSHLFIGPNPPDSVSSVWAW